MDPWWPQFGTFYGIDGRGREKEESLFCVLRVYICVPGASYDENLRLLRFYIYTSILFDTNVVVMLPAGRGGGKSGGGG